MQGTLYLVTTPIGNLGDISRRAVDILSNVDFIAAEDTRVTIKLLNHFNIKKPMISYYRHNEEAGGEQIVKRLLEGENCALVSDAGTPAISDPGEALVTLCIENEIEVTAIPGASALIAALCVSGLPTGRFTFEGFLAMNKKNRINHLNELKSETRTMIFYEAPHKLLRTLEDFSDTFGTERQIAICRELTKKFEEILRMTVGQAVDYYRANSPKGEFVLVLSGSEKVCEEVHSLQDAVLAVRLMTEDGMTLRDAVKKVAKEYDISKNELYNASLNG